MQKCMNLGAFCPPCPDFGKNAHFSSNLNIDITIKDIGRVKLNITLYAVVGDWAEQKQGQTKFWTNFFPPLKKCEMTSLKVSDTS